jgi:hypothetical protein
MLVRDSTSFSPSPLYTNSPMVLIIFFIKASGLLVLWVPLNIYRCLCLPLKLLYNFYELILSINVSLSPDMKIISVY